MDIDSDAPAYLGMTRDELSQYNAKISFCTFSKAYNSYIFTGAPKPRAQKKQKIQESRPTQNNSGK
jgi:hypothetical protein